MVVVTLQLLAQILGGYACARSCIVCRVLFVPTLALPLPVDAQMLKRGEVVKDRWRIEERLGKGTFCELHRASDLVEKTEGAAVKVEVQGMQRSVLKVRGHRWGVVLLWCLECIYPPSRCVAIVVGLGCCCWCGVDGCVFRGGSKMEVQGVHRSVLKGCDVLVVL